METDKQPPRRHSEQLKPADSAADTPVDAGEGFDEMDLDWFAEGDSPPVA